jgi:TonB family protein
MDCSPRICRFLLLTGLVLSFESSRPAGAQTLSPSQEAGAAALLENGEALLSQREYRRAITSFEQANRIYEGRCAECLLKLARVYTAWERPESALEAARTALQLNPPAALQARIYNQVGVILAQRPNARAADLAEAEAAFRQALKLGGEGWNPARYNLAGLLFTLRRSDEAAVLAREYLRREPEGPYAAESRLLACRGARAPEPSAAAPEAGAESEFFPPSPLFRRIPLYPSTARRGNLAGSVAVQVEVDSLGCAVRATLSQGLGNELDAAAVAAVAQWVFNPATTNGQPVTSDYLTTVEFNPQMADGKDADRLFRDRALAKWPAAVR